MRAARFLTCVVFGAACQSAPSSVTEPETAAPPPEPEVAMAAERAPPPPQLSPDERYARALQDALETQLGGRPVRASPDESSGISVAAVRKVGRDRHLLIATAGLHPAKDLELVVHVNRWPDGLREVLGRLAERYRAHPERWVVYEPVELESPVQGLLYFDLRPGGEVEVLGRRIELLKVIPLSGEEFRAANGRSGSQWMDDDAADPERVKKQRARWGAMLEASRKDGPSDAASDSPDE